MLGNLINRFIGNSTPTQFADSFNEENKEKNEEKKPQKTTKDEEKKPQKTTNDDDLETSIRAEREVKNSGEQLYDTLRAYARYMAEHLDNIDPNVVYEYSSARINRDTYPEARNAYYRQYLKHMLNTKQSTSDTQKSFNKYLNSTASLQQRLEKKRVDKELQEQKRQQEILRKQATTNIQTTNAISTMQSQPTIGKAYIDAEGIVRVYGRSMLVPTLKSDNFTVTVDGYPSDKGYVINSVKVETDVRKIIIPGKKYNADLKRSVFDAKDMIQNDTMKTAYSVILDHLLSWGGNVGAICSKLSDIAKQCDLNGTTVNFLKSVNDNLSGIDTNYKVMALTLALKCLIDARDLIIRCYSKTEEAIRAKGYKFVKNGKGTSKTFSLADYIPEKSKAYKELGITKVRESKGISPYPKFTRSNILFYGDKMYLASQNVLHKPGIEQSFEGKKVSYENTKREIKEKIAHLGGGSDIDFENLFVYQQQYYENVTKLKSDERSIVAWMASRDTQLPILILSQSDLYVIKACKKPQFVPLGYRSIIGLQQIFPCPIRDPVCRELPADYYNDVYNYIKKTKGNEEDRAKKVVNKLAEYVENRMVDSFKTRTKYNLEKSTPLTYEGQTIYRGLTNYPPAMTRLPAKEMDEEEYSD